MANIMVGKRPTESMKEPIMGARKKSSSVDNVALRMVREKRVSQT